MKWYTYIFLLFFLNTTPLLVAKESPEITFINIQKAIDYHDIELFKKYILVEPILVEGVSRFFNRYSSKEGYKFSPSIQPLLFSIQNPVLAETIQELFVKELMCFVEHGVTSGFFAGEKSKIPTNNLLSLVIVNSSEGRKELIFSKKDVLVALQNQNNKEITIPINIKDYGNGNLYPVVVNMKSYGSIWKIYSISNIDALIEQMEYKDTE